MHDVLCCVIQIDVVLSFANTNSGNSASKLAIANASKQKDQLQHQHQRRQTYTELGGEPRQQRRRSADALSLLASRSYDDTSVSIVCDLCVCVYERVSE
jgi:hypothetical protein